MFTESVLTDLSPAAAQLLRQIGATPDTEAGVRARWYATLPEPPEVAFTAAVTPLLAHGWVEPIQVTAPELVKAEAASERTKGRNTTGTPRDRETVPRQMFPDVQRRRTAREVSQEPKAGLEPARKTALPKPAS